MTTEREASNVEKGGSPPLFHVSSWQGFSLCVERAQRGRASAALLERPADPARGAWRSWRAQLKGGLIERGQRILLHERQPLGAAGRQGRRGFNL